MENENLSEGLSAADDTGEELPMQNRDPEEYSLSQDSSPEDTELPEEEPAPSEKDEAPAKTPKRRTGFRIYTPVIIAAAVLIVTVLIFSGWKVFFEKNIKGIWTFDFTAGEEQCSLSLELADDGVCYFHEGAIIYKGTYKFSQAEDGQDLLKTNFTEYGQPAISANFYYTVEGSNASGKTLVLTDLTGLIFSPYDTGDETGNDPAELGYDYFEKDGLRYFRLSFRSDNGYETKCEQPENAKKDDKLTGIWLNTNDDSRHDNTFAFFDDNTFQITYRDVLYKGCYSAENGKCTFRIVYYTGQAQENEFDYKFEDDKLIITIQNVPAEYTRTDSVTAFDNGIK